MKIASGALLASVVSGHSHNGGHRSNHRDHVFVGRNDYMVSTVAGSGHESFRRTTNCAVDADAHVDGQADRSKWSAPTRVQVYQGVPYVLDSMNGCIRSIRNGTVFSDTPCCTTDISTGVNGWGPQDFKIMDDGYVYFLDSYNNQIKGSPWPFQKWSLLAGNGSRPYHGISDDGPALETALNEPHGMAVATDGSGDIYFAETWSSCVKLIRNGVITTVAGKCGFGGYADGDPADARFQHPHSLTLDPRDEGVLYVNDAECWDDEGPPDDQKYKPCKKTSDGICFSGIRKLELNRETGLAVSVSTVTGQSSSNFDYKTSRTCNAYKDGDPSVAQFNFIHGTAFLPLSEDEKSRQQAGEALGGSDVIYVADEDGNRIRAVDLRTGIASTIAGNGDDGLTNGKASKATFNYPGGLGLDLSGNIYVGDYESNRVRLVTAPTKGDVLV